MAALWWATWMVQTRLQRSADGQLFLVLQVSRNESDVIECLGRKNVQIQKRKKEDDARRVPLEKRLALGALTDLGVGARAALCGWKAWGRVQEVGWVTDTPQIQQEVERREARFKDNMQIKTFKTCLMKLNTYCYYDAHIIWEWKGALVIIFWEQRETGTSWMSQTDGVSFHFVLRQCQSPVAWNERIHFLLLCLEVSRGLVARGWTELGWAPRCWVHSSLCSGSSNHWGMIFSRRLKKSKRAAHLHKPISPPAHVTSARSHWPLQIRGSTIHPPWEHENVARCYHCH